MEFLVTLLFCTLIDPTTNPNDMIEKLKTYVQNNRPEKTISFIRQNPEVLNLEDENGTSGLMIIAYSRLEKVFDKAIELKKSFSFHEAVVAGRMDVVKNYLEQDDADFVNTYSNDGFTPLSLAAFFNQTEIAKLLVEYGADPNRSATNPSKVNALHSAVAQENMELCKLFIDKGADVNLAQTQNVTPLHAAVHRGNLELTQMLIKKGASIESAMDNGDKPLTIAKREGHRHIEEFLLKMPN